MKYKLKKHDFGFNQIYPIPNEEKLKKYYADQYYQNSTAKTYSKCYTKDELNVIEIEAHVSLRIFKQMKLNKKKLLDIACGEGFFMNFFDKIGWDVLGIDYSKDGLLHHNSHLIDKIMVDKLESILDNLITHKKKFSFINLGNILEHVTNPIGLLEICNKLLEKEGILRVKVPNDFSDLQNILQDKKLSNQHWICPPDHISYFNFENLKNTLLKCNFLILKEMGDFPIEMYLLNKHSNYSLNDFGKEAHNSRTTIVNLVWKKGINSYMKWSEGLASAQISRSCIFYCKPL